MYRLFFAILLFFTLSVTAHAASIMLAWDPPLDSNGKPFTTLAGYNLYVGSSSRKYETIFDVGNQSTYTVVVSPGQKYYFTVTAYTVDKSEGPYSNEIDVTTPGTVPVGKIIPSSQIKVISVSSVEKVEYSGEKAIDDLSTTMWHTSWTNVVPHPHTITLDLGQNYLVDGWSYTPRTGSNLSGNISKYEVYVSSDHVTWKKADSGTFTNTPVTKVIRFLGVGGRYVKIASLSEITGKSMTSIVELEIFGTVHTSVGQPLNFRIK